MRDFPPGIWFFVTFRNRIAAPVMVTDRNRPVQHLSINQQVHVTRSAIIEYTRSYITVNNFLSF